MLAGMDEKTERVRKKSRRFQFRLSTAVAGIVVVRGILGLNLKRPSFSVLTKEEALQEYEEHGPCIRACLRGWPFYQIAMS